MIKYAGAPQLGDYVMVLDDINNVYQVDKIEMAVDEPIWCYLSGSTGRWNSECLTRVQPEWNVGELVRYNGRVHQILIIEVKNYKFVYSLDNISKWIAEKDLEYVDNIRHLLRPNNWFSINKYCVDERFRGMKGRINVIGYLGADCSLRGIGPESYYIPWEAIDVEEKKVEPYNAELICVYGGGDWKAGELAKVINNHMVYVSGSNCMNNVFTQEVHNLNDVNKLSTIACFEEIKETIGDKRGWNGKFYVVDSDVEMPLKVGNVYVVKEGILNVGAYSFTQIFTSFEEIQKRFDYATLIEVKE